MDITANELTKWAKKNLEYIGYKLNRVNNIPYGKRKNTVEKGWADLQGLTSTGIYVGVEIKKLGDKISIEQKNLFDYITKCGGIILICTEQDGQPVLIEWIKIKS